MITVKNNNSNKVTKDFDDRKIEYAFHDIDGTHSLIRDWPPVMSICLYDVIENGLSDDFDSLHNVKRLISLAGTRELPETDAFCVESAGLSALTQMEWAIRRSVQEGKITVFCNQDTNAQIIALSALMTTTMKEMDNVVKMAKEKQVKAKIIIGGAVITQDYCDEIQADGYSKDAAGAVKCAERLLGLSKL